MSNQAASSPEQVTLDTLILDFKSGVVKANGDALQVDKVTRDFKAGVQRLSVMDKSLAALVKVFDAHPELLTALAKNTQDLANRAAQGSITLDQEAWSGILALIKDTERVERDMRMSPDEGKASMYRFAGVLAGICELCGFKDGADYLNNKINEWKSQVQVTVETAPLSRMLSNMGINPGKPISVVESGTRRAVEALGNEGTPVVHGATRRLNTGINNQPTSGPLTGAEVGPDYTPRNSAAAAIPDVQALLQRIGKEAGIPDKKVEDLVKAGVGAAEVDGKGGFSREDLKLFTDSKPYKGLTPQEQKAVRLGLELELK